MKWEEAAITYPVISNFLRREGYEVGGKLWSDGFGLVAAGLNLAGDPHAIVSLTTETNTVMVGGPSLITAMREARAEVLATNARTPLEAARWLTTMIEQWERDHPADRPN